MISFQMCKHVLDQDVKERKEEKEKQALARTNTQKIMAMMNDPAPAALQ